MTLFFFLSPFNPHWLYLAQCCHWKIAHQAAPRAEWNKSESWFQITLVSQAATSWYGNSVQSPVFIYHQSRAWESAAPQTTLVVALFQAQPVFMCHKTFSKNSSTTEAKAQWERLKSFCTPGENKAFCTDNMTPQTPAQELCEWTNRKHKTHSWTRTSLMSLPTQPIYNSKTSPLGSTWATKWDLPVSLAFKDAFWAPALWAGVWCSPKPSSAGLSP